MFVEEKRKAFIKIIMKISKRPDSSRFVTVKSEEEETIGEKSRFRYAYTVY